MKKKDIWNKKNIDYWVNCGMLTFDDVILSEREVNMHKLLENVHYHKITRLSNGMWMTRVPDPDMPKGRMIRRNKKSDLLAYLIEFYGLSAPDTYKVLSFGDVFNEWVEYKRSFTTANYKPLSPSTVRRYERDYRRFISDTELEQEPISVDDMRLEKALIHIIKSNNMTQQAFSNLYGYIDAVFTFAIRARYIASSPMVYIDKARLMSFCTFVAPADDSDRVLTLKQLHDLINATNRHLDRHPTYMPDYGILLACLCGMRVGEISALHWGDIDDDFLHVDYSEHRYDYDDHTELVIGEPKNYKHRVIPMTDEMRDLFYRIRALDIHYDDFIFCTSDKRYSAHDISCACDRRAREAGISDGSSIHELRRTVSSYLNTILPRETVAVLLGHLPETNAHHYDYDITDNRIKIDALSKMHTQCTLVDFSQYKKIAKAL